MVSLQTETITCGSKEPQLWQRDTNKNKHIHTNTYCSEVMCDYISEQQKIDYSCHTAEVRGLGVV